MKLIRKLGTRISRTGRKRSYAIFWCDFCKQEVEKTLEHGLRDKSCGCERYKLSSKKLKGKKRKPFTEEHKQNIKKGKKGKKLTEEHKDNIGKSLSGKYVGELASNWQDGISNNPYGVQFNRTLKKYILKRDNCVCQNPNCVELHPLLDVHHIDYEHLIKDLIVLCRSCHSKINGKRNRKYWIIFYQNIMTNRFGGS